MTPEFAKEAVTSFLPPEEIPIRGSVMMANSILSVSDPLVTPKDSIIYFVTIENGVGCKVTDSVTVDVLAMPEYFLQVEKYYDCWNTPKVRFLYATDDNAFSYTWILGD